MSSSRLHRSHRVGKPSDCEALELQGRILMLLPARARMGAEFTEEFFHGQTLVL